VLDIRDHWPQTAPKGGLLSRLLWKPLGFTVSWAYARADLVVGVSPEYARYAAEFGVGPERYATIPNGFDEGRFPWPPRRDEARTLFGLAPEDFVVSFIGTVGTGMGLEATLDALALLQPSHPDLRLLVVGQGASRADLEAQARARGLPVLFRDYLPSDQVHLAYAASDLSLASLEARAEHRGRIPAKTFEILGCGLPMLAVMPEGPAWDLISRSGAGLRVPPGDAPALAETLAALKADPHRRLAMARQGRDFILANYSRHALAGRYLELLEGLPGSHPPRPA
jgi:glycosyltransferase involved in cell wall biosynthesis